MCPKPADERYAEWLERMDIPIEATKDIETFKNWLREEAGITEELQVSALWDATEKEYNLEEHGIRAITITYPWGRELRYGVQGLPGLWGWESVQEIMREEE